MCYRIANRFLPLIIIIFLINGCSIQQRHYTSGYYLDRKGGRYSDYTQSDNSRLSNSYSASSIQNVEPQEVPRNVASGNSGQFDSLSGPPIIRSKSARSNSETEYLIAKDSLKTVSNVELHGKSKFLHEVPKEQLTISTVATWSLVLGILAFFFGFFTGIPGIICGSIALRRIKENPGEGGSARFARAGIICGIIGSILYAISVALAFHLI